MEKRINDRKAGDCVPGSGYLKYCPNERCERTDRWFYTKLKAKKFCCERCKNQYHNQEKKENKFTQKLYDIITGWCEKILKDIYTSYGNKKLSIELLRGYKFSEHRQVIRVMNKKTGRRGERYNGYVLCWSSDGRFFQVFTREEFPLAETNLFIR